MKTTILLTKEDITTTKCGLHYVINAKGGISLNFTPDAVEEFVNDVTLIKSMEVSETSKMPFKAACEAIKSGSHQIEKDCDNLDLLRDVLKEAGIGTSHSEKFVYFGKYSEGVHFNRTDKEDNLPIIKLSEIMPKEEKMKYDALAEMEKLRYKIERQQKRIDKIVKVADSIVKIFKDDEQVQFSFDVPVKEKEVELVVGRWYKRVPKGHENYILFCFAGFGSFKITALIQKESGAMI